MNSVGLQALRAKPGFASLIRVDIIEPRNQTAHQEREPLECPLRKH